MSLKSINQNPLPGNSTTITVRATDSAGKSVDKAIVVTVTPVNNAPSVTHQDQVQDTGTNNASTTADAGDTDVGYEDTPLIFNANPSSPPITFDSPSAEAGNPTMKASTPALRIRILISDPDSTTLTVTLTATHGTLTLAQTTGLTFTTGNGTANTTMTFSGLQGDIQNALGNLASPNLGLTFNPDANFNGLATLTVTANDGSLQTTNTTNLIILAVNDDPVATPDTATVNESSSNTAINVLTNDNPGGGTDEAGQAITVIGINSAGVTTATTAHGGTATIGAGGQTILYTPAPGYFGPDTFQYVIQDNGTSSGTVNPNPTGRQQLNGGFVTSISDPKISLLATVTVNVTKTTNQSPVVVVGGTTTTDEDINIRLGTGTAPAAGIQIKDDVPNPLLVDTTSTEIDNVHLQATGGGNAGTFNLNLVCRRHDRSRSEQLQRRDVARPGGVDQPGVEQQLLCAQGEFEWCARRFDRGHRHRSRHAAPFGQCVNERQYQCTKRRPHGVLQSEPGGGAD